MRQVTELTPFPYLIYYPVNIRLGREAPFGRAALVPAGWGAAGWLTQRYLWRRCLGLYSAMCN